MLETPIIEVLVYAIPPEAIIGKTASSGGQHPDPSRTERSFSLPSPSLFRTVQDILNEQQKRGRKKTWTIGFYLAIHEQPADSLRINGWTGRPPFPPMPHMQCKRLSLSGR